MEIGVGHQEEVGDDLHHAADDKVDDRRGHVPVGLHHGVAHQDDGVEDHRGAQVEHDGAVEIQILPAPAKQNHDGLGQAHEAEGAGHGDEAGQAHGGGFRAAGFRRVVQRQMAGDSRDDGDGDGGDDGAGQVEDGLAEVVDALDVLGVLLGEVEHAGEAAHIDHGVHHVDDLQACRAQGDGNGDE